MADSASATGIKAKAKLPKAQNSQILKSQRGQRIRHIIGRCDVDGGQALLARALDILGEIVEEHDALRGHPDRLYHMMIGGGVRFPKPDRAGQEDFAEMAE